MGEAGDETLHPLKLRPAAARQHATAGPYSPVLEVDARRLVVISGQVAVDLDEPLSNLDADLRAQMRIEIARLHNELETTMIYVTHDQLEAMTLADRIVVLNGGRIEQAGPPLELYERPRNQFVAGFLGQPKMNFIRAEAANTGGGTELKLPGGQSMRTTRTAIPGGEVLLGIRPDAIVLGASGGLRATVSVVERLGGSTLVHASVAGVPGLIAVELPGKPVVERGSHVDLTIDPLQVHVFNGDGLAQY